jgi:hypothetical protein
MQSLVRAIKRGNAVIVYDQPTLRQKAVYRKGTSIDDYLKERKK